MHKLIKEEFFVHVHVEVEGQIFAAHTNVLVSSSEYVYESLSAADLQKEDRKRPVADDAAVIVAIERLSKGF